MSLSLTSRHLRGAEDAAASTRYSPEAGESIREYMRRFSQARCQVQDITEASVINAASAGLLEGEITRNIANKEPQTLEHLLRIIDGCTRGEEDSKRRQAIQAEYDKASVAAAQAQVQAHVAEPPPLAVHQPQPVNQGQPPRQGQAPMTWRKFRTDRAGKAVMAVEEVQTLRKEFARRLGKTFTASSMDALRTPPINVETFGSVATRKIQGRNREQLLKHLAKPFKNKHPWLNNAKMCSVE